MIVAIEKKPKANAEMAENATANAFLNFSWRRTETAHLAGQQSAIGLPIP